MNKDKSIEIQKQVRDNSSDLRTEFLDMKHWEEQMKKAEAELTSTDDSHQDKACEEIEKENESEDSGDESLSKEDLEKKYDEAVIQKVLGNKYVTEKKWDKAMACYNEAIKIFPYDAVFYANRALCHLKMDNLYSAEADCTAALQHDEHYVKAYHRRATARMALKQYKEAISDLEKLLTLEKDNKEAKKMLEMARKYLSKSTISLTAEISSLDKKDEAESKERNNKVIEKTVKVENEVENKIEEKKENKIEEIKVPESKSVIKFREWLPIIDKDVDIVKPINKLPHQRIKKPLKSIPVNITDFTKWSDGKEPTKSSKISTDTESLNKVVNNNNNEVENKNIKNEIEVILAVPRTSVQFCVAWRKNKSPEFRYKYLKQLSANSIPTLFQDSMESDTFSEILTILKTYFIDHGDPVYDYLKYLSEIKRFRTLIMFLGKKEKEVLTDLFDYCKSCEGRSNETITDLRKKYEL
ncbi:RNA polymerase II-associated protein spaghetti isoform X2 [Cotesia typhae]|uniref:RNA polymerase II-associated protein spaghetti isoform X2 n=1 Tax=Cotesia typhae TaxID=2053667 RepID=UPI003D69BE63